MLEVDGGMDGVGTLMRLGEYNATCIRRRTSVAKERSNTLTASPITYHIYMNDRHEQ